MFFAINYKFLEFSKSLYYTSKMHYFDYQIIFGVNCNSKWGKRNKKILVSISHYLNLGYFDEFLILRKMQGENTNEIHHVYNAIVVLHICNRILGIPLPGYHRNKNQILMLIKF